MIRTVLNIKTVVDEIYLMVGRSYERRARTRFGFGLGPLFSNRSLETKSPISFEINMASTRTLTTTSDKDQESLEKLLEACLLQRINADKVDLL